MSETEAQAVEEQREGEWAEAMAEPADGTASKDVAPDESAAESDEQLLARLA